MTNTIHITVTYTSVDGGRKNGTFKTLKGAQAFAQKWAGKHPEMGSSYAISGDGVGKVSARGATLNDLFPAPVETPAPVLSEQEAHEEAAANDTAAVLDDTAEAEAAQADLDAIEAPVDPLAEYGPAIHAPAPRKAAKPAKAPRASKGINLAAPGFKPIAARAGTKTATLIDFLAGGTTLGVLRVQLAQGGKPWTDESIKVGFGYDVKLKGYGVRTVFLTDADAMRGFDEVEASEMALEALSNGGVVSPRAVYFLVLPECATEVVSHTQRKGAVAAA